MAYIIGLGGVRAAGKSTLARQLSLILRADVISSGRTREMIRAQYGPEAQPELFESVTEATSVEDAIKYLYRQTELIKPSMLAAIKQCREREANLIIEGTHVIPGLYKENFDFEVLLVAPREKLEHRIHKDKQRRTAEVAIQRSCELQEHLKTEALKNKVLIIDTTSIPEAFIKIIKSLPDRALKTYFT